jgi:multidrug efflux pump subunit AcrB
MTREGRCGYRHQDAPGGSYLYRAAEVQGVAAPGIATGTALHRMEGLANQVLPPGIGFEWTEIAYQQQQKVLAPMRE